MAGDCENNSHTLAFFNLIVSAHDIMASDLSRACSLRNEL